MKKIFLLIASVYLATTAFAQKETAHWYFGYNAGIDFTSGVPVNDPNGALSATEGCTSMSDGYGNLLFYSDGQFVWNKNHAQMPNGNGLMGGGSSSQSALAFPDPANLDSVYYIFTIAETGGANGLRYSKVDLKLNGGLGDVTSKNVSVVPGALGEKVTACYHANGVDFWVTVHGLNNSNYYTALVTAAGVQPAVMQTIGAGMTGIWTGGMSFNAQSTKCAMTTYDMHTMELIDFDNSTGVFSNPVSKTFPTSYYPYSTEFSASGNYLYCCNVDYTPGEIYQFDMNAGSNAAIIASGISVHTFTDIPGDIQLALDGKIYFARYSTQWVGVINSPDSAGTACNAVNNAVNVSPGTCALGLPDFVTNILGTNIQAQDLCLGDSTHFSLFNGGNIIAIQWNFGDPNSGANNTAYIANPAHQFTDSGTYNVQLILVYLNLTSDTINTIVNIGIQPVVALGNDTTLCIGQSLVLNAGPGKNYLWQDGSTNSTYTATVNGTYGVEVTNNSGCKGVDSINVDFIQCAGIVAALSSSDTLWCDKTCIDFTDLSLNNPTSWTWYFQGASPSTSTDQNPTGICYNNYGSFDVTLVACNAIACDSLFLDDFVTEFQLPVAPTISYSNDTLYSSPAFAYQWYNTNNINVVLSTNNYFVPVVDGNYFVLAFDSNGCSVPSPTFGFYTSFQNLTGSSGISVFPNPASNELTITLSPSISENVLVELYDITGRIVVSKTINEMSNTINLQNVNAGTYQLKFITEKGAYVKVISKM
nr:T9SS type A sorting domain-containing protein [Bacteroidota bacterium]